MEGATTRMPRAMVRELGLRWLGQWEVIRYRTEQLLALSYQVQFVFLVGAVGGIVLLCGIAYWWTRRPKVGIRKALFKAWGILSSGDALEYEENLASLLVVSILSVAHLLLFSWLVSATESRVASLAAGHTRVIERQHLLILGWNPNIFDIIRELQIAADVAKRSVKIVVLNNVRDKSTMCVIFVFCRMEDPESSTSWTSDSNHK